MGFANVVVMIPFCRSVAEADRVLAVMAENGLRRGEHGLEVYVMCEIPSNVILARAFAERFDGFSIGSNDLTQLTLGVDRDSEELAELFDEQDDAVKWMIESVIREAHKAGFDLRQPRQLLRCEAQGRRGGGADGGIRRSSRQTSLVSWRYAKLRTVMIARTAREPPRIVQQT
jgi:phosphoenolpyruvate synthase/pyruvate phosphate dikinase